jgi:hypothetical protein
MNDPMLPLSGLSPVAVVNFDGGLMSSDGGDLFLREVEQRLRVADRMAACLAEPRAGRTRSRTRSPAIMTNDSGRLRRRQRR